VYTDFLYLADAIKKKPQMKKNLQLLKIVQLFIFLPHEISNIGSKKRAYIRIKEMMIAANLL
jgi:hypothetical protein